MMVALTPSIRGSDNTLSLLFGFSHVDLFPVRSLHSLIARLDAQLTPCSAAYVIPLYDKDMSRVFMLFYFHLGYIIYTGLT